MSLQYLLDGYNIIHQIQALSQKKLDDQRQSLVHFIENHRPQGSVKNRVTIVFDGKRGSFQCSTSDSVEILYSQSISADEMIKEIVEKARNKKNYIVVTNDRDIQYAVRSLGAKVLSVEEFLDKPRLKKGPSKNSSQPSKHIPKSVESSINSELENIWLKKKGQ